MFAGSLVNDMFNREKVVRELGKHFTELFEKRNRGGYNNFVDFDEAEARAVLPKTVELIDRIKVLIGE